MYSSFVTVDSRVSSEDSSTCPKSSAEGDIETPCFGGRFAIGSGSRMALLTRSTTVRSSVWVVHELRVHEDHPADLALRRPFRNLLSGCLLDPLQVSNSTEMSCHIIGVRKVAVADRALRKDVLEWTQVAFRAERFSNQL